VLRLALEPERGVPRVQQRAVHEADIRRVLEAYLLR
jgi:hypothetical protein